MEEEITRVLQYSQPEKYSTGRGIIRTRNKSGKLQEQAKHIFQGGKGYLRGFSETYSLLLFSEIPRPIRDQLHLSNNTQTTHTQHAVQHVEHFLKNETNSYMTHPNHLNSTLKYNRF